MKDTIKTVLLVGVILGIPIGACIFLRGEMVKEAERGRAARYASVAEAYQKGFFEGSKATLKNIQFDTNSGKWTLEITNVLNALNRY